MRIHINRSGQSLGQFEPHEVREGFKSGKFNASDLAWRDGMAEWRPLGSVIDEIAPDDGAASVPAPPPAQDGPAWEHREEKGALSALFETVRAVLLEPSATFATMRQTGGLGTPLLFFLILGMVAYLAGMFYQVAWYSLGLTGTTKEENEAIALVLGSAMGVAAMIVAGPLIVTAGAFLSAGITHLFLMIVGGAKKPFEATFRVICYAAGATAVLQLLPVCGAWIASVWILVAEIIGLSEVHGIGRGRAAAAVLLPLVLCCGLIALVVTALVLFGVAMAGGTVPKPQ